MKIKIKIKIKFVINCIHVPSFFLIFKDLRGNVHQAILNTVLIIYARKANKHVIIINNSNNIINSSRKNTSYIFMFLH